MRVALAQLNPIVGNVPGNLRLVLEAMEQARAQQADLLVLSELVLLGYPPRDLLLREGLVEACEEALAEIARRAGDLHVLVGHPRVEPGGLRGLRNSASLCHGGEIITTYDKRLLPGYDVFDEDRYFDPGQEPCIIEIAGRRVAVLICEDLWKADDVSARARYTTFPVDEVARLGCDVLVTLNASPFVLGKFTRHLEQLREAADRCAAPVVSVNQIGANDDLVFDGRSTVIDHAGELRINLPAFEPAFEIVDLDALPKARCTAPREPMRELWGALVLSVRDYCAKTDHQRVHVGLSGGIDSAVSAAIAVKAVGPANVFGVMMPSKHSSRGSIEDARELAIRIGLATPVEIPIRAAHNVLQGSLAAGLEQFEGTVTDENVQARLRGLILMALSNASNSLVLSTSNKSEMAVGYSTLYGDMCGAVAPLADVTKTRVYELARWVNAHHGELGFDRPPIPENSITKPPSAELRPNQTDQDTLPEYVLLDAIIERYIEREQSADQIIEAMGLDAEFIEGITRMIDRAEYKRHQASVIPKVTPRAFGSGRVMPIVMKGLPLRARV